jgi:hypothetical protein
MNRIRLDVPDEHVYVHCNSFNLTVAPWQQGVATQVYGGGGRALSGVNAVLEIEINQAETPSRELKQNEWKN